MKYLLITNDLRHAGKVFDNYEEASKCRSKIKDGYVKDIIPFVPPKVKPEKPISSQSVKLTLDETGLKDAIGNLVTSFETILNNNVEVTKMITKPKYIVKSKTPGVPIKYCETKLEAEHYKDLQSTWGYELEIIEPESLTNHTQTLTSDLNTAINTDLVNHPAHYNEYGLENLEAIEGSMSSIEYQGFLKASALKYIYRFRLKGNPVMDLDKAINYLTMLKDRMEVGDE